MSLHRLMPGPLRPAPAAAVLCVLLMVALIAGHEGARVAQMAVLAMPVLLWLRVPLSSRRWRAIRYGVVSGAIGLFLLDGAVRAFIRGRYAATPDSSLVLGAVANTTHREMLEYAASQAGTLAVFGAGLVLSLLIVMLLVAICNRHAAPIDRRSRWVLAVLAILCVAALISKPWRRHHPALFWPHWSQSVETLRTAWADQEQQRRTLLTNAQAAGASTGHAGPSTVVLVLTDSVNRDNMSLYGYPRLTTPELAALGADQRGQMLTLRHAWSAAPGTLASLSGIFSFGARDEDDPVQGTHHVLALARAAGYRVWWMSNHDDVAIDQQHAQMADHVEMINREPGRSTSSLDGELLDCLEEALADEAPRKLIVVHLLGAHPHYRLRSPEALEPFPRTADAVDAEMSSEGRPSWLRAMRRTYDKAIRYHDAVVAQTLRLTLRHAPPGGHAAWMFLSDHGQEVGHDISHAGHSPGTAAGYRIPALLWHNGKPFDGALAKRPFRADWAGWTLADLMHLDWEGKQPERNVLDPAYVWTAPDLEVKGLRFDQ